MSISVSDACATCGDPTGIDPFFSNGRIRKVYCSYWCRRSSGREQHGYDLTFDQLLLMREDGYTPEDIEDTQ